MMPLHNLILPPELIVAPERTGMRDMALSARHRVWGRDCLVTDIDFLEYCQASRFDGWNVSLNEWKHEQASNYTRDDANMHARMRLDNAANLPLFLNIRADDFSWVEVIAKNKKSRGDGQSGI